jgi:calcium-translocating P-type ATPase
LSNYNKSVEQLTLEYGVDKSIGLSKSDADTRSIKFGRNEFAQKKKESILKLILHPLLEISAIILMIAAVLSFIEAFMVLPRDFISPIVILSIITVNCVLSVTQQLGAEKALDALSKLNAPQCHVIREGVKLLIDTVLLVPGDIIVLKTGDLVPADARVIDCTEFLVDESSLTGESEPIKKSSDVLDIVDAPLGDQKNMLFSGCLIAGGNAKALVLSTGMNTEIGKIAKYLSQTKKRKTPLQVRLDKLARVVCGIAILAALCMLALGIAQKQNGWHLSLMVITLAVAAVPETLAIIVTLILIQGIKVMASKKALVRKLPSVETLGSTSVICSDKTGTLTQNKMTVTRIWRYGDEIASDEDSLNENQIEFLQKFLLCTNATVQKKEDGTDTVLGDPTESALIRLALKKQIDVKDLKAKFKRVAEIPFSSSRKMMTVVVKTQDDKYLVLTKGAFDRIPYSINYVEQRKHMDTVHDTFTGDALRVIALATRTLDSVPSKSQLKDIERELVFEGFVGIIDPPRPEVRKSIALAKNAGIRTIMITGDHASTATAIARDLGIIAHKEGVISGQELHKMTDDELYNSVEFYSVYARVSPEDKIRIVQAWQKLGAVVSMTGDGVNDAPALKAADVGVAMGVTGTEVAKSASDMVLLDDKFSTIVEAVAEGRNIFANIRKAIYFLIACNLSEIFIMLFGVLLFRQTDNNGNVIWWLPVTPVMLLLVNVLGDGVPGLALCKERSDSRIMKRKPFNRSESFFGGGLLQAIIQQSLAFTIVGLLAYYIGSKNQPGVGDNHKIGQTMTFLVLGWTSIIHVLTVRSRKSVFKKGFKGNRQLLISVVAMLLLFVAFVVIPGLNSSLHMTANLGIKNWLITIGLSILPIIVSEYSKFWDNYRYNNDEKNRVEQRKIA